MDTKDVIFELRTKHKLSQEELAEKIYVTRQAVSRWETGETVPNTQTLKLLSEPAAVSLPVTPLRRRTKFPSIFHGGFPRLAVISFREKARLRQSIWSMVHQPWEREQ